MKTKRLFFTCLTLAIAFVTFGQTPLLVDDFESGTLHPRFRKGNPAGTLEIIDNPASGGINTSAKVLKVTNNWGSQQVNVDITKNQTGDDAIDVANKGYDRFRFKYYSEVTEDRKVMWKHNGNGSEVDITVQPTLGAWSYAEIEMTEGEMNSLDMIHLRLNHKLDGTNGSTDDIIYIDDLEFYNSSLASVNQQSGIISNAYYYNGTAKRTSNLSVTLDENVHLRVELIGLNGSYIKTLVDEQTPVGTSVYPFEVEQSGFYLAKILINNQYSSYLKIMIE